MPRASVAATAVWMAADNRATIGAEADGRWNTSIAMLKKEQERQDGDGLPKVFPQKSATQNNSLRAEAPRLFI